MVAEFSPSGKRHASGALFDHPSSYEKIACVFERLPVSLKQILDAGCGDGRLASYFVTKGFEVSGLDANEEAVNAARKTGIDAYVADLENEWPQMSDTFDVVLLLDVLEHVTDPSFVLNETRRVLREDGHVIVAFPNHFDIRQRFEMLIGNGIVHWSHKKYKDAKAVSYGHVRFLRAQELLGLFREQGFAPLAVQYNFMGGGLVPRRLLPAFLRRFLLQTWPNLFSGKFVVLAKKTAHPDANYIVPEKILLAETPEGL